MSVLRACVVVWVLSAMLLAGGCAERANREDFAAMVKNKTEQEVAKYAGKPDAVDDTKTADLRWVYKSRTFDVTTRKTDANTIVVFGPSSDGKRHVVEVRFE